MVQNIPDHLMSQLGELVSSQTGLYFPKDRWRNLKRGIDSATLDSGFEDTASYIHSLLSSPFMKKQLDTLVEHLTIGETFFFRDKKVFQILKEYILSAWTRSRQGGEQKINFWSAGCCTGEEPYSIAMLIDQMIPAIKNWEITILGTDINSRFLKKARKGVYTTWSFRETPDRLVAKYFKKTGQNSFEISPHIKKMVRFCQHNLAEGTYPAPLNNTHTMDVIFFRNVLMYFTPELRTQALQRIILSLAEGGWLIVSPSETPFVQQPNLNAVWFPGTSFYRKGLPRNGESDEIGLRPEKKASFPSAYPHIDPLLVERRIQDHRNTGSASPVDSRVEEARDTQVHRRRRTDRNLDDHLEKPKQDTYQEALNLYEKGSYEESVKKLNELVSDGQSEDTFLLNPESMALKAKSLANLGRLDEAQEWALKAASAEKMNPGHHYLLATIYQEQGHLSEAIKSLRRSLYLDPKFVLAHFVLGNLIQKQEGVNGSTKHLENAFSLLLSMDHDEILPYSEGMTAGRLMEVIRLLIVE